MEYGRGSALTVHDAKEIAAEQALRMLWAEIGAKDFEVSYLSPNR